MSDIYSIWTSNFKERGNEKELEKMTNIKINKIKLLNIRIIGKQILQNMIMKMCNEVN
jgi:membrane protein CcdC involved in cytochrome C biogenesis